MKISEVAELTGLTISNTRFYERKGLIAPDRRQDSKYREYTPSDVDLIKKIVLYRKMDLSIEEIQTIINESIDDKQVVREHLSELKSKRDMLDNSLELCEMYIEDKDSDFDTEYYLSYVKSEEQQGRMYSKVDELYGDLEEYAMNTMLPNNSLLCAYIPEIWRKRISVFVWGMMIVGLPLVALLHYGEEGFLRIIIIWVLWCIFFFVGFAHFRKIDNSN